MALTALMDRSPQDTTAFVISNGYLSRLSVGGVRDELYSVLTWGFMSGDGAQHVDQ